MRRVIDFLTNMDARAWRTVAVSFLLFGGVGTVFLFAAPLLGLNSEAAVEQWLGAAHGVWALPVAVSAFAVLAFIGVPQFVLIAAEPQPIRVPREPRPVVLVDDGPLVLVETRKDLSQMKLPFEAARH